MYFASLKKIFKLTKNKKDTGQLWIWPMATPDLNKHLVHK